MFNIYCEVWNGATGHRSSLLKKDDKVVVIESFEEACVEAARLNREMNTGPGLADFSYTPKTA